MNSWSQRNFTELSNPRCLSNLAPGPFADPLKGGLFDFLENPRCVGLSTPCPAVGTAFAVPKGTQGRHDYQIESTEMSRFMKNSAQFA